MIAQKELRKLFRQLLQDDVVHISTGSNDVAIRMFDHNSKLSLTTLVYFGGNFIPLGVRASLLKKALFAVGHVKTFFTVDEQNFSVSLNYLGGLHDLNNESFRLLIEDFSMLADEWRLFIDDHDKNDLVHVHVK